MKLKLLLASVALALGVAAATSVGATTTFVIDNLPRTPDSSTPSGGIASFGELARFENGIAGFYGQSFVAPSTSAVYATDLLFSMETYPRDIQQGPVKYRVLLVATGDAIAPNSVSLGNVIFTSPEMLLPENSQWTDIAVNLENTKLVGGLAYLWVLDGYSNRNGITGDATVGTKNDFSGGDFYYGGYLSASGVPLSSIDLNPFGDNIDLAFKMTFTAAPEPSTWAMLLLGFVGLGFVGYRRARAGHATFAV